MHAGLHQIPSAANSIENSLHILVINMINMNYLLLVLPLLSGLVVRSAEVGSNNWKEDILRNYFASMGFKIDPSKPSFLYGYDEDVVKKMNELFVKDSFDDNNRDDYDLEAEINSMIYESALAKAPKAEDCKPIEPADEALMRAINLIVPDPADDPNSEYPLAKSDLWRFYVEQPERAQELLKRLKVYLDAKELHTDDAARLLRNFYYHWIPLARLEKFIDSKSDS